MIKLSIAILSFPSPQNVIKFARSGFQAPRHHCVICRPFTSIALGMTIPSPPLQYGTTAASSFRLEGLNQKVVDIEDQRQQGYDLSRKIHVALVQARQAIERNQPDDQATLMAEIDSYLGLVTQQKATDRDPRVANLSYRMEDICRVKAFQHFLSTGQLMSPAVVAFATDEEYLAGACMGLAQDLQRYGLGRATARDVESVTLACDLVRAILDYLLKFDFRNGPLRRKYDGTKYSLKALETLLYELAVTATTKGDEEPTSKRPRAETSAVLPEEELEGIRLRMEQRDEMRENLIKKCRDGQKAAKQAIFALHRGDKQRALQLLVECEQCIREQLLPIVHEEPPLRSGSFSNVLEEYVEARLFACWLYGKNLNDPTEGANGVLLEPDDFDFQLQPDEYLGGLCDLTGEVGRYAVQRGTLRDNAGVRQCLQTNRDIQTSIESVERLPANISKKMDQVLRSVEKLERMLYEMSLSEAVGRNIKSEVGDASMEAQNEE